MKRLFVVWLILISLFSGLLFGGDFSLASNIVFAKYQGVISVSNNSTAATNVATVGNWSTQSLIDGDYLNATATDLAIRNTSGTDIAFQPGWSGNQWAMFVPSIGEDAYLSYLLYTGNVTGGKIRYFPGLGGMTTPDSPTLEPGSNFTITQKGYVDVTAGSNKNLVNKTNAVSVYADTTTTGTIKASIGQSDNALAQVIIGGSTDTLANSATEYNVVMGGGIWQGTESANYQLMPTAGTISRLYVSTSANIAAGTATFSIVKNGAAQALSAVINTGTSSANDLTNSVSFVAGDTISLQCITSGAAGAPYARWTVMWTSATANESIFLLNATTVIANTIYGTLQGNMGVGSNSEPNNQTPIPTNGTFSKLYVKLSADPGNAPDDYKFMLRKTAGDTTVTTTITADNTTGNSGSASVAVVSGNLLDIQIVPENVPLVAPTAAIGMVFTPTVTGESVIMGGTLANSPSTGATNYTMFSGARDLAWDATETNVNQLTQLTVLSKFYVNLNSAPDNGAGVDEYTFTIMEAGGSTGLVVNIQEAATTGSDTTHTWTLSNGAVTDIRSVPANTPAVTVPHWGVVSRYIGVSVSVSGITPTAGEKTVTVIYQWNVLSNSGLEIGNPPTGWFTDGAGLTWVRSNVQVKYGSYSGALTRGGGDCDAYTNAVWDAAYQNQPFTLGGWIWSSVPNTDRLYIWDGVGASQSAYHPGDSTWQYLFVNRTLNVAATQLIAGIIITTTDQTAYVDGLNLVQTATLPNGSFNFNIGINGVYSGIIIDSTDGNVSVPDNSNNWSFLQNNVMPYMEYQEITIGGAQEQYIDWEYGAIFNDTGTAGHDHDATPTFRNSSSDPDVLATLTSFGPITESKAPAYSAGAGGTLITTTHNVTGNFSSTVATNVTIPGAQVVQDASTASSTPSLLPLTILSAFVLLTLWLVMGFVFRRFGTGHGTLFFKILVISAVMGFFVATHVMDFWQLVFWLLIALAIAMASQHQGFAGVTSELNLIGFLAMAFVGMTLVNRVLEGSFISSSDVGIINTLTWTKDQIIFGTFSIPVPNTDFFFVGLPRLVKWDYSFFGGNAGIMQYFLYSFTAVAAFMAFLTVVGLLAQYFLRTR